MSRSTAPPGLDQVASVLVVKPSSLGDIVHTLPAVGWLKQCWPHLRLHWVANSEWAPLLEGSRLNATIVRFPRQEFRGLGGLVRARRWSREFSQTMRLAEIDLALDFQGLLRSAWLARRSGARHIVGLADAREGSRFFHTTSVPVEGPVHAVDRALEVVRLFQPSLSPVSALAGDWLPTGSPGRLQPPPDFLLLHPFSRGSGKSLSWAAVVALARHWSASPVVVVGHTAGPPPPGTPANLIDATNRTSLDELIWLMRRARAVVSVDSGPMHVANALHRPLLAIHTWSDPRRVGPYGSAAWIWKGRSFVHRGEVTETLANRTDPVDDAAIDQIGTFVAGQWPPTRESPA